MPSIDPGLWLGRACLSAWGIRRGEADEGSGSVGDGRFYCPSKARERSKGVVNRASFVSAMNHAVAALLVATFLAVLLPRGVLHELLEGGDVAVLEEITRFLPTEDVEGGISPRGTIVIDVALEEFKEVGGKIKFPRFFAVREDLVEQLFRSIAPEEVLLVGGFLVTVPRGKHHAFHFQFHHLIKKFANARGICSFEKSGIGGDAEPAGNSFLNSL